MKKISPSRIAAFEILQKIETEKAYSSALLPTYEVDLSERDAALCHTLTLGVLRRKIYLDRIIAHLTQKKLEKLDVEVLTAIRLGIFQLLFLDRIPNFSAINESVNLVHRSKKRSAAALVNAVLRRIVREGAPGLNFRDEIEKLSVETSHPRWLVENWITQFGFEKTASIANANNLESKSSFRFTAKFNDLSAQQQGKIVDELETFGTESSRLVPGSVSCSENSLKIRELANAGMIYFQDEGSQLVAHACRLEQGETALDVCAAPGSKTGLLAANSSLSAQSLLVAGDFHSHRVRFLKENFAHQGVWRANVLQYDAADNLPFAYSSFDVVLLDAPCSGTGTIRNNPEIRYNLEEKDIHELSAKQLIFLKNASKVVKSGGRLIYSTCSLERRENEEVIETFLADSVEYKKVDPPLAAEFLTDEGFARTDPSRFSMDGFFIAELRKAA